MEQKEKIEKPEWVETVETMPEIIRQQVGTTCAGTISALVQIWFLNETLYEDVLEEVRKIIYDYSKPVDKQFRPVDNDENV